MAEIVRGRYAPSPSGDLHLGNLRTALLAWLFVRMAQGQILLRIEDLDHPRVLAGASQRMLDDLRWLGLDWDEGPENAGSYAPYIQSERLEIYQRALHKLQTLGFVYPCYCSRAEIALAASAPQQGAEQATRYPGTCRTLTEAQRRQYEANGRRASLRFRVDDARIVQFTDLLTGPSQQHVQQAVGDFIILRSDGIFAYQFAVVVDDALMHINQVVRGIDLLDSTARQILLFEALGYPVPTFAHVPLVLDVTGKRLAKRTQSSGLAPLRATGKAAEEVVGQLASTCGLVEPGTVLTSHELVQRYAQQTYDIMRPKLRY